MNGYDGGYRSRSRTPSWADPRGGYGQAMNREGGRAWVGGYRDGYQGGSGGYQTSGPGGGARYGGDYSRGGGDYWWMGERAFPQRGGSYDQAYRQFDRENRPQYSPVGGMYHAMGGEYRYGRPPRPLREDRWFSDWTRYF